MKITSVRVYKRNDDTKLKGIATVEIDDCFKIRDIRIIEGEKGLFLAMPNRKNAQGNVAHPLNSETRAMFEDAIFEEYNKVEE